MENLGRSTIVRSLLVAVVAVVVSAGACRQEWDGPLPSPDELGAAPLPHPSGGFDAVYATRTGPGANGEQCHRVLVFAVDGELSESSICTSRPVSDVLDELGEPHAIGDYSHRDGVIRARLVSWDSLVEELVLDEFDATICGSELSTGSSFELVGGDAPPGAPPCPTP